MAAGGRTGENTVASVVRALSLLEAFGADDYGLTLAELSRRTGLYKSTILRLIQTLESFGYLERTADGTYRIGAAPVRLASLRKQALHPADLIFAELRQLVDQTRESASYHVRQGDKRVLLYRVDSPLLLRDHQKPGDIFPLDRGAVGAVFMAFERPQATELAHVRERLVSVVHGELEAGMTGIASPVFDAAGHVAACVVVSGAQFRFEKALIPEWERMVLRAARRIATQLGVDPAPYDARLRTHALKLDEVK